MTPYLDIEKQNFGITLLRLHAEMSHLCQIVDIHEVFSEVALILKKKLQGADNDNFHNCPNRASKDIFGQFDGKSGQ
jgi:hypothetical protein